MTCLTLRSPSSPGVFFHAVWFRFLVVRFPILKSIEMMMAELFSAFARSVACDARQAMHARRRPPLLVQLCLLLGLSLLAPRAAQAMSDKEAADTAVDIFVQVAQLASIPIPDEARPILKEVVGCAMSGTSGPECGKNVVVSLVLQQLGSDSPEAVGAAKCLVGGGNAKACLQDSVIGLLPKEAQPLAKCVADGGNIGDCTAQTALKLVFPQVGNLPVNISKPVECIANGGSLESCASSFAASCKNARRCIADALASQIDDKNGKAAVQCLGKPGNEAQACIANLGGDVLGPAAKAQQEKVQQALATIDKMKLGAIQPSDPRSFPQQPAALRNLTLVAQGLRDGDIGKVLEGGGTQIAQIAGRIIINIFLPGMASILGPVSDMMIVNNVTGIVEAYKAIKDGDPVGLAAAGATWYATKYIVPVCGLMPDGEVKNITCGTVAKAIGTVVGAAADVAKAILNLGKEFLEAIGLWNAVDGAATAIWNGVTGAIGAITGAIGDLFSGDDPPPLPPAISPAEYFAKNMASACLGKAAAQKIAGGQADISGVVKDCTDYYEPYMIFRPLAEAQCKKLAEGLGAMATATSDNLLAAARAVTSAGGPINFAKEMYDNNAKLEDHSGARNMCSPTFWTDQAQAYASFCVGQIDRDGSKYPASMRNASTPFTCSMPASSDPMRMACLTALREYKDKYVWAGRTAEDSAFCKKQKKDDEIAEAMNPCRVTKTKVDAGGKTIEVPRDINCDRRITRPGLPRIDIGDLHAPRIPYQPKIGDGVDIINYRPGKEFSPVPFPLDPPRLQLPKWQITPVPPVLQPPKVSGPKGGGKGGPSLVLRDDGPGLKPPSVGRPDRKPPRLPTPVVNNGQGSGGAYYVDGRSGNAPISAMDRLGNINAGGGINGVAGNSGGAAIGRSPMMPAPSSVVAGPPKPPAGGSGGPSYVNGASGNSPTKGGGSGGAYMVNGASGNSPVNRPATSAPRPSAPATPPGFDRNIDFGGCSNCGTRKDPLVVR